MKLLAVHPSCLMYSKIYLRLDLADHEARLARVNYYFSLDWTEPTASARCAA